MKKSSYSKKIVKLLKKEYKEDLEKSKIKTELNSSADSKYQTDSTGFFWNNKAKLSHRDWVDLLYTSWTCSVDSVVKGPKWISIQFCYLILTTVALSMHFLKRPNHSHWNVSATVPKFSPNFSAGVQTVVDQRKEISHINPRHRFIPVWGITVHIPVFSFYRNRCSFSLVTFPLLV